ncbi:MAG: hypothetical protein ACTSR2_11500 [Candidatus Hodarchaeales archaeon]
MGKEEKMLTELLEKVSSLEDKLTNMEFLMVQGMGSGGSAPTISAMPASSGVQSKAVEVDLAPIEGRLQVLENNITALTSKIDTLAEITNSIKTEKTEKADDLITQATTLLEKGLQLTELETTLLELKDRMEEITVQLEVLNVGTAENSSS